ncbi:uncharacterized protein CBL_07808 [Carabus blaptoides fortunei]
MTALALLSLSVLCFTVVHSAYIADNPPARGGCIIDVNRDFTFKHPLLLQPNASTFILPSHSDGVQLFAGQKARLVCAGNRLKLANVQEVEITCLTGDRFRVNNSSLGERRFKELLCTNYPKPWAQRTGRKCLNQFSEIEIGFKTSKGFVRVILVCFDPQRMDSVYSVYNLTAHIGNSQYNVPRPGDFITADFYPNLNPQPSTLYTRKSERTNLARIIGQQLAQKYIANKGDYFLSRGHLTAKADFVYGAQQRATFFYVNVAPQWQTFNGNNWNELEMSCRRFAEKSKRDLTVYTGVHGHAKLDDKSLYLFTGNTNYKLTVPAVFWKVLHDPVTKAGIAFVGHNNPYDTTDVTMLCTNICNKVNWLSWDAKNITAGYSYCCDVTELQRVVQEIPDIPVHGLLS